MNRLLPQDVAAPVRRAAATRRTRPSSRAPAVKRASAVKAHFCRKAHAAGKARAAQGCAAYRRQQAQAGEAALKRARRLPYSAWGAGGTHRSNKNRAGADQSAGRRRARQSRARDRRGASCARGAGRGPGAVSRSSRSRAIRPRTCCSIAVCGCQIELALEELKTAVPEIGMLIGYPEYSQGHIYNSALPHAWRTGARAAPQVLPAELQGVRRKALFHGGHAKRPWSTSTACGSDCWSARTSGSRSRPRLPKPHGAEMLLVINASPYEIHKQRERELVLVERVHETGLPAVYVNLIGGQDELVFDGNSFADRREGTAGHARRRHSKKGCTASSSNARNGTLVPIPGRIDPELARRSEAVLGTGSRRARLRQQARVQRRRHRACQAASTRR